MAVSPTLGVGSYASRELVEGGGGAGLRVGVGIGEGAFILCIKGRSYLRPLVPLLLTIPPYASMSFVVLAAWCTFQKLDWPSKSARELDWLSRGNSGTELAGRGGSRVGLAKQGGFGTELAEKCGSETEPVE
ncbi:hypothetical protein B296_00023676 [Ensete ventricosum]|uniref:Uncharacterized protein n=1 Tax=Ensete ventricosum TaxID=4639 RepID=A0A427AW74_ENSVE|nr:hypothetical protein B296_00023676 [Ensete ventricosum]